MTDRTTPNLPARDFAATSAFYARLGFAETYRDKGWMILKRGDLVLEFFPFPDLDPTESSFGCCLRVDDLDSLYEACLAAGIPERRTGMPRLVAPRVEPSGMRIAYMVDEDGTLLRLVANPST